MGKKLVCALLVMVFAFLASPITGMAHASRAVRLSDMDEALLVSEISYMDEEGNTVTERLYFQADLAVEPPGSRNTFGAGWYTKEKNIAWNSGSDITTIWVKAYFAWGNGDVSVSSASTGKYGYSPINGSIVNTALTTGTGRFAVIFNKYAYAEATWVQTSAVGIKTTHNVKITVSESGNPS